MFKKLLLSILVALLSFSIFACGNKPATKATTAESAENDETEVDYLTSKITGLRCASEYPSNTTIDKMDAFKFGNYTQNNTSNEALEWIVLDKQSDKALLISKYTIDCKPYNETSASVNWDNSTLKTWLNNDFKNSVFSLDEKNSILNVIVPSINDMNNYFNDDEARKSTATKYAKDNGCWVSSQFLINGEGTVCYFLSDNGDTMDTAAFVGDSGKIGSWGSRVNLDDCGIRPAIWVKYDGESAGALQINSQTTNNSNDNQGSANSSNDTSDFVKRYSDIKAGKLDNYATSINNSNYKKDCKMDLEGNLYEYETYDYEYNYRVQNTQSLTIHYKDGRKKTYYYTDGSVYQSDGEVAKIDDVDSNVDDVLRVFNEYKNMIDNYSSVANSKTNIGINTGANLGTNFGSVTNSNNSSSNTFTTQISSVKCVSEYAGDTPYKQMDSITFGNYYQSNDTTKEPIEWLVLEKQGDKALLISKYVLDGRRFNEKEEDVSWKDCSLRKWLNETFINDAFSVDEKSQIISAEIISEHGGENGRTDKSIDDIFILSDDECEKYMPKCAVKFAIATKYASEIEKIDIGDIYVEDPMVCRYLTRESNYGDFSGEGKELRIKIQPSGLDDTIRTSIGTYGVRPAMWVTYNSQSSNSDSANANNITNLLGDDIHIDGADIFKNPDGSIQIGGTPQDGAALIKNEKSEENNTILNAKLVKEYAPNTTVDQMDTVTFGSFPQSDVSGNVKDPIEWVVLDRKDGKAFLVSKYILDRRPYNVKGDHFWKTSSIREWLNNEFYVNAFSDDEKQKILETKLEAEYNEDDLFTYPELKETEGFTNDKLFCLSLKEIEDILAEDKYEAMNGNEKRLATRGTEYARKTGNNDGFWLATYKENKGKWYYGNSQYWLRSPDRLNWNTINFITYVGYKYATHVKEEINGVRPAMWVKIN